MSDLDETVVFLSEPNYSNIAWFQVRESSVNIEQLIQVAATEVHILLTEPFG